MAEELWQLSGYSSTIQVPATSDNAALEAYVRESEIAIKSIGDKQIKRVIVVPGKLVNLIVG